MLGGQGRALGQGRQVRHLAPNHVLNLRAAPGRQIVVGQRAHEIRQTVRRRLSPAVTLPCRGEPPGHQGPQLPRFHVEPATAHLLDPGGIGFDQ